MSASGAGQEGHQLLDMDRLQRLAGRDRQDFRLRLPL
jgi:hypothetical protein